MVREVGVALGDLDVLVAGEFLGEFEVAAGGAQHSGDEVVAEGVRGDTTKRFRAEALQQALFDDVAAGSGGDGFDLFAGAFVVAGEERHRANRAVEGVTEFGAQAQVGGDGCDGARGKTHNRFLVAFANDERAEFFPVHIAAPQADRLGDPQSGVGQGKDEGAVAVVDQGVSVAFGWLLVESGGVVDQGFDVIARELRQAFTRFTGTRFDKQAQAFEVDIVEVLGSQVLVETRDRHEVQLLGGGGIVFEFSQEPPDGVGS